MYRVCIPVNNKNYTEKEWDSLIRDFHRTILRLLHYISKEGV